MPALPNTGDTGWGVTLNNFLTVGHDGNTGSHKFFVNVKEFGAVGNGSTDDAAAIQNAINSVGSQGGLIFFPPGTYRVDSSLSISYDNTVIMGAGQSTVIRNGAVASPGIISANDRNRIMIRELRIECISGAGSTAIHYTGGAGAGTENSDIVIENVTINQQNTTNHGIIFTSAGRDLRRISLRNVNILGTGTGNGIGLAIGAGAAQGFDIVIENCVIDKFRDAFDTNQAGNIHNVFINNAEFKNAGRFGARFYHCGQLQITNSLFEGNDVGAYFDNGAGIIENTITNCRFVNNTVLGAYTEEWAGGTISNCVFSGNGYGFWCSSGRETSITGCTFINNTNWGINTDNDLTFTGTNGTDEYKISNKDAHADIVISGCVVSLNGTNGIEIKGISRSINIAGCVITRNGQQIAPSGDPTTSGFASIVIGKNTGGSNNSHISIKGCVLGNPTGSGGIAGFQQYGIVAFDSASWTSALITGCDFYVLKNPIILTFSYKSVLGNHFFRCSNLFNFSGGFDFSGGILRYRGNSVIDDRSPLPADTLVGTQWENDVNQG